MPACSYPHSFQFPQIQSHQASAPANHHNHHHHIRCSNYKKYELSNVRMMMMMIHDQEHDDDDDNESAVIRANSHNAEVGIWATHTNQFNVPTLKILTIQSHH